MMNVCSIILLFVGVLMIGLFVILL